MNTVHIARDVIGEALARKTLVAIFVLIFIGLLFLALALDLEVVDGALAASRLFGKATTSTSIIPVDVAMRPVFAALTSGVFYLGLVFGVLAVADIAPKMLRPGRVELLLSLPVRRFEVVVGTYLGVLAIAAAAMAFAIFGASCILFYKAQFFTSAPLIGAVAAIFGFAIVYALMLLVACSFRSAAASAGAGFAFIILCMVTDRRDWFVSLFRAEWVRTTLRALVTPLPKLMSISELGGKFASDETVSLAYVLPLLGSGALFAVFCVALAAYLVSGKDY